MIGSDELEIRNPDYLWVANYKTFDDTVFDIEGTEIEECPASSISPWAMDMVHTIESARQEREATGENSLPPVRTWPVRLLDAATLIWRESNRIDIARHEAQKHER